MFNINQQPGNQTSVPGFRFSITDGLVIVLCLVVTGIAWVSIKEYALGFPIVLSHFFLFCNVFRIGQNREYLWAAIFVVNVALWTILGRFNWWIIVGCQTPLTLILIVLAIVSKDYHGIGYQWKIRDNLERVENGS